MSDARSPRLVCSTTIGTMYALGPLSRESRGISHLTAEGCPPISFFEIGRCLGVPLVAADSRQGGAPNFLRHMAATPRRTEAYFSPDADCFVDPVLAPRSCCDGSASCRRRS